MRPIKEVFIGDPEPLVKEDMVVIFMPAFSAGQQLRKLRNSHHRLARLAAAGLRNFEIANKTGYSEQRVWELLNNPAMQELVAHYRKLVNEKLVNATDEYTTLTTSNMLLAEQMISDRLDEASSEDGEQLPIKDLLAISRDAADRNGYGKKSTINHKTDFAERLEQAVKRSREIANMPKVV